MYLRSHHRNLLKHQVVKHPWHPKSSMPNKISPLDVKQTEYCDWQGLKPRAERIHMIVRGWNDEPEEDQRNDGLHLDERQNRRKTNNECQNKKFVFRPDKICADIREKMRFNRQTIKNHIYVILGLKENVELFRGLEKLACTYSEFVIADRFFCTLIFAEQNSNLEPILEA